MGEGKRECRMKEVEKFSVFSVTCTPIGTGPPVGSGMYAGLYPIGTDPPLGSGMCPVLYPDRHRPYCGHWYVFCTVLSMVQGPLWVVVYIMTLLCSFRSFPRATMSWQCDWAGPADRCKVTI